MTHAGTLLPNPVFPGRLLPIDDSLQTVGTGGGAGLMDPEAGTTFMDPESGDVLIDPGT